MALQAVAIIVTIMLTKMAESKDVNSLFTGSLHRLDSYPTISMIVDAAFYKVGQIGVIEVDFGTDDLEEENGSDDIVEEDLAPIEDNTSEIIVEVDDSDDISVEIISSEDREAEN